jgi:hypothetical protein
MTYVTLNKIYINILKNKYTKPTKKINLRKRKEKERDWAATTFLFLTKK